MSSVNSLGPTGGGRPPSAVVNTNDPGTGGGGANTFLTVSNEGAIVGNPVLFDFPENTLLALPAQANAFEIANVAGIVTSIDAEGNTVVQTGGIVELTVDQWAAVTGLTGIGLNEGNIYFLSNTTPGLITADKPVTTGSFISRVGVAISATQLLLQLSCPIGPHA